MDVTIVAIRSKRVNFHSSVSFDVRDEFDVLLQSTGEGLPKVTVAGDRNHSLLTFIYDLTGLKGYFNLSIKVMIYKYYSY